MKLLVTRTDRLGDTLMSVPALKWLREQFPQSSLTLISQPSSLEALGPLLKSVQIDAWAIHINESQLRLAHFDAVLFLIFDAHLAKLCRRAGIRTRVGAYSKPLSFFYLNTGVWQRRSRSEKNEAEYNLDLAYHFAKTLQPRTFLHPRQHYQLTTAQPSGQALPSLPKDYVILHPGMGGSALNLSAQRYLKIIRTVEAETQWPVFISVGPAAQDQKLKNSLTLLDRKLEFIEGYGLPILSEIFSKSRAVIGPSTGPLHLAHYVGATTIGIYSPIKSHQPKRWAPWGGLGKSQVFVPLVDCPAKRKCQGEACCHFNCMERFDWESHLISALKKISAAV